MDCMFSFLLSKQAIYIIIYLNLKHIINLQKKLCCKYKWVFYLFIQKKELDEAFCTGRIWALWAKGHKISGIEIYYFPEIGDLSSPVQGNPKPCIQDNLNFQTLFSLCKCRAENQSYKKVDSTFRRDSFILSEEIEVFWYSQDLVHDQSLGLLV